MSEEEKKEEKKPEELPVSLFDLIMAESRFRGILYYRQTVPLFIASIAAHILNLRQDEDPFYFEASKVSNLRLHILFVAPPGFGKSYWLSQFLAHRSGMLFGSAVRTVYEGSTTGAGFVGTLRESEGEIVREVGMAEQERESIVGIQEFSAVTNSMKAYHSRGLDNHLLTALDDGQVVRRLRGGKIEYTTGVTLWAGVQPARFDLSSGLGRRFVFILFIPSIKDRILFRETRWSNLGRRWNDVRTLKIREAVNTLVQWSKVLKQVTFKKDFFDFLRTLNIMHYEDELFERVAIGITYAQLTKQPEELVIQPTPEIKAVLHTLFMHREAVKKDAQYMQVVRVLEEEGGESPEMIVRQQLLAFGLNWSQSGRLIENMKHDRIIRIVKGTVKLRGFTPVKSEKDEKVEQLLQNLVNKNKRKEGRQANENNSGDSLYFS